MRLSSLLAAAILTAAGATAASAASLTITSVSGVWQNASPGGVTGTGTPTILWGNPATSAGQSSYNFDGDAPPDLVATEGEDFTLGTFTHANNPVFDDGTILEAVDLLVTILVDGVADPITSTFSFEHLETPNNDDPCADGGANGEGVNVNGCSDSVSATLNLGETESFIIDDVEYVFTVTGFVVGGEKLSTFWTVEEQDNEALLLGNFVTKESVEVIPLPAAGWLLIAGMGGLAALRRRAA